MRISRTLTLSNRHIDTAVKQKPITPPAARAPRKSKSERCRERRTIPLAGHDTLDELIRRITEAQERHSEVGRQATALHDVALPAAIAAMRDNPACVEALKLVEQARELRFAERRAHGRVVRWTRAYQQAIADLEVRSWGIAP
jgi:hypothetical protein